MGYSVELRQRVIQYVRSGGSKAEAARRFQVSRGRVYAWLSLPEDQLAPAKPGPKSARKVDMAALAAAIEAHPDRLQTELAAEFGVRPSTIHDARRRLGITRKKQWRYAESDPLKRRQFLGLRERYRRQGKTLLCLDESGFEATAQRPYAYAPRRKSVVGYRSGHTRPRTSLLAARVDGRFVAPWLFPGICNTTPFNTWLAHPLCPLLDETMVVILDHAAFHKSQRSRELIEATGVCLLFLPPYSPDLNPIEKTFGSMKRKRSTVLPCKIQGEGWITAAKNVCVSTHQPKSVVHSAQSMKLQQHMVTLISGLLFGLGLGYSQMIDPEKVIGFLDLFGEWDPTLAFVMGGAVAVTLVTFRFILKRPHPIFGGKFYVPTRQDIDKPLVIGAALFGIGWGIGGYCPGPAITALVLGSLNPVLFIVAMIAGSLAYKSLSDRTPPQAAPTPESRAS